jgi:hypothetical protein
MHAPPMRPLWSVLRMCAVVIGGVLIAVNTTACGAPATPTARSGAHHARALGLSTNWTMPVPGAHMTTIGGAHATAGFVIPMPEVSSPIQISATPARQIRLTLSQVWVSPMRQVALLFDGGG